jgi:hypothetical protein
MSTKKILVISLLGIFLLAGVLTPYITQAAQPTATSTEQQCGPGMMVQRLASNLGIDENDAAKYIHQGVKPRDLAHASLLAKASNKTLPEVLQMKTLANTWQDVRDSLGVTKEQLKALRQDMLATRVESKLAIPKDTTLSLLQQGYRVRDIEMAGLLAQNTNQAIGDVLAAKKINNRWNDVATNLGVDETTFKQDLAKIHPFQRNGFDHQTSWGTSHNNF